MKAKGVSIGSICGGGRYDNLTGVFGMPDVSGVGISFGADRIYDVMREELDLFPKNAVLSTQILFINFGEKEEQFVLPLLKELRKNGVKAELYPDQAKLKKQMAYADFRQIPFVALIGEEEMILANFGRETCKLVNSRKFYLMNCYWTWWIRNL